MISRSKNFSGMGSGTADTGAPQTGTEVKRIWLVDDSREFRILLARFLEQLGDFECSRQFPSAEAVIDALCRETPPDAILLDFNMGGMTGLDALGPIKALVGTTPVLMLTTFSYPPGRALALRSGASDYLLKSFSVAEIAERIRQACRESVAVETAAGEGGTGGAAHEDRLLSAQSSADLWEWPERRAPIAGDERHRNDDISQAYAEPGRPIMRWRSASLGLARGVRYLRSLMGALF